MSPSAGNYAKGYRANEQLQKAFPGTNAADDKRGCNIGGNSFCQDSLMHVELEFN